MAETAPKLFLMLWIVILILTVYLQVRVAIQINSMRREVVSVRRELARFWETIKDGAG
jgi:predicted Holliday junction resolvase-like endonuclease